jgi:hypothetical protein
VRSSLRAMCTMKILVVASNNIYIGLFYSLRSYSIEHARVTFTIISSTRFRSFFSIREQGNGEKSTYAVGFPAMLHRTLCDDVRNGLVGNVHDDAGDCR